MSIESVMPSNYLILCCPFLPPSIFPSISLFQWIISSHQVAKVLKLQPLWEIVKYNFTIWPNNLTDRYFSKRNENTFPYQDLWVSEWKSHSRVWLFATLWIVAHQAPLSKEFSRQEMPPGMEWVAMPFLRDLPYPGIEPRSPALQADFSLSESPGKTYESVNASFISSSSRLEIIQMFITWWLDK